MKRENVNFRKIVFLTIIMFTSAGLMAQRGGGYGKMDGDRQPGNRQFCEQIPDMTPEQEQKINDLRTVHLKEMNNYRNDLMIKRAELNKLQSDDNADIGKINAKIDEIGNIRTEMAKKASAHRLSIRSLLTENQRAYFDARRGKGNFQRGGHDGFRCRMN